MDGTEEQKEKYCVSISGPPKRYLYDTMPVLQEMDNTLAPIKVFYSIDDAVNEARLEKVDHPEWDYEVRKYLGNNSYMPDIEKEGRWRIGVDVLRRI